MQARRRSRPVRVGPITIGGDGPIVIQSMTTTTPDQLEESLAQIEALAGAGCPLVRLAVPSMRAAEALGPLCAALEARGLDLPLVADVHFNPRAAYEAAKHVHKVRINPGNFAKHPQDIEGLLRPLLDLLRERNVALRVGVNHGSLAPHIADSLGHGPPGMVASAMEYLRVCRAAGFEQIVVSLKASNPTLMVAANRLLAARMREEQMDYPIHLGVTEAGAGLDGILRSTVGIAPLLADGIGDTIRVSLTGDPTFEIPVCRDILSAAEGAAIGSLRDGGDLRGGGQVSPLTHPKPSAAATWQGLDVGGDHPPRVEARVSLAGFDEDRWPTLIRQLGAEPGASPTQPRAESIVFAATGSDAPTRIQEIMSALPTRATALLDLPIWIELPASRATEVEKHLCFTITGYIQGLVIGVGTCDGRTQTAVRELLAGLGRKPGPLAIRWQIEAIQESGLAERVCQLAEATAQAGLRLAGITMQGAGLGQALATLSRLEGLPRLTGVRPLLSARLPLLPVPMAVELSAALLDGGLDLLSAEPDQIEMAYALLQATRRRLTRTEFISCPGCGRLDYDLDSAVARIKARFGHLRDVKIAIMGCAVNGPGEMADADFGYVGAAGGKVDLYAGAERVTRGLTPEEAEAKLEDLLRERGVWREP